MEVPRQKVGVCGSVKYTRYHVSVFVLTFFGYAFYHATRKTFSNVKTTLENEWTPNYCNATISCIEPDQIWNKRHMFADDKKAEYLLGTLDALFLVAYAVGLYISGFLGDRYDPRKVLSFGMLASAISVFMFGCLSAWLHIYSIPWYVFWWTFGGLLQSTGWPSMVAVMANWFGHSSRGLVLGLWSACASVGNIIGSLMAAGVVDYGYEYAFLLPASCLAGGAVVIYFGLVVHPNEVGLQAEDDMEVTVEDEQPLLIDHAEPEYYSPESDPTVDLEAMQEREIPEFVSSDTPEVKECQEPIGFLQALLLPGVIPYSLSYACLKLVNYSFFFWLPFYLTEKYGWTQSDADELSIWYDIGGIVAGTIAGFISDRMQLRAPVVTVLLVFSLPALYGYSRSPNDKLINAVLMTVTGFCIGGPSNLISSAIAADMGKQSVLGSNKQALATVTGIVDGTGSAGGAIGQLLIPIIELHLGWHYVFYLFMVMTSLTIACVFPILVRELKTVQIFQNRQESVEDISSSLQT